MNSPYVADPENPTDAELAAAIQRGLDNGMLITAEDFLAARAVEHKIRWFVYVDGERIPRTAQMRGNWGYDATCEPCGWDSRTGGGTKRYVSEKVEDHKLGI